jgi:hypothetical protein
MTPARWLAALNVSTHAGRVSRSELEQRFLPSMLSASREPMQCSPKLFGDRTDTGRMN